MLDERLTYHLVRHIQFDADHQSTATHLFNMRAADVPDAFHQVVANDARILHQILLFEHVEHSQCCCTSQMITSKGRTKLSIDRLKLR